MWTRPTSPPQNAYDGTFLWISLVFVLLPFIRSFNKIGIGKLVTLERNLEKPKRVATLSTRS
jgi:hypothetical protein